VKYYVINWKGIIVDVICGQMKCKIYPSTFSGEVVFQVDTKNGNYEGVAPKHYVNYSVKPGKEGVYGQVKVHVISNGVDKTRVSMPDGQILTVSTDLIEQERGGHYSPRTYMRELNPGCTGRTYSIKPAAHDFPAIGHLWSEDYVRLETPLCLPNDSRTYNCVRLRDGRPFDLPEEMLDFGGGGDVHAHGN
jgi:hypothetical protein